MGYAPVGMRLCIVGTALFLLSGCSNAPEGSPFSVDAGMGDVVSDRATFDAESDSGTPLGNPCLDDRQCDDLIPCTFDTCNRAVGRCQNVPDDSRCQNDVFCDGVEVCDPALGCRRGQSMTCGDEKVCTIDRCVEEKKICEHKDRDADGDGNPDGHCVMGGDCDDTDPNVFTGHPEICGNRKDDDCDGEIDETACQKPVNDTCLDPLVVVESGIYEVDTTAAAYDYGGTCAPMQPAGRRDVVVALELKEARDVDVVAEAPAGTLAIGIAGQCDRLATEIACAAGLTAPLGNVLARVRARNLAPGSYPLYVWADRDEKVILRVTQGPPGAPPTNETCGTAAPIAPGSPVVASLTGTTRDVASRCVSASGDLVYQFDLTAPADVTAFGTSIDGQGSPVVSLRRAACAKLEDEIACGSGQSAKVFARALPAGTYYVAVAASAPTDVRVELKVAPVTPPPSDDRCDTAPRIEPNRTIPVSLYDHTDDIALGCSEPGAVDAAYSLEIAEPSDVLLLMRFSSADTGAVSLAPAACGGAALACNRDFISPVRAALRNAPAGTYRAVVETRLGNPLELTALVRKAVPPSLVPFADTCATAPVIDEAGGFYQGNTANAQADYSAGCDTSGPGPGGAPDQMLKLVLSSKRRVIFDMQGSSFATLLDIRKGDSCPGAEIDRGCSAGYVNLRSFVDVTLDPGSYWVQVDGFNGEQGTWFLDVRVIDP
ncbi:MAG: putative metal-binding motif-containing protein [Polyangiaceae bacterium]